MNSSWTKIAIFIVASVVTLLSFQSQRTPHLKSYSTFQIFNLLPSKSCQQLETSKLFSHLRRIETVNTADGSASRCQSSSVEVSGDLGSIEIASKEIPKNTEQFKVELWNQSGELIKVFSPQQFQVERKWQRLYFEFDPESTHKIYVTLTNSTPNWVSLRNRITFFESDPVTKSVAELFANSDYKRSAILLAALGLFALAAFIVPALSTNLTRGTVFLVIATAVHFRIGLFFNIDDWDILWSIREGYGASRYLIPHLEHTIPLFKALLHLQYQIFGGNYYLYLGVSLLIHTFNALLLYLLLEKILCKLNFKPQTVQHAANLTSLLYLISALHTEVMTWMICQSSLLAASAILLSSIFCIQYLESRKAALLPLITLCSLCAPLLFGGGFLVLPFVIGIIIPTFLLAESSSLRSINFKSLISATVAATLPIILVALVYRLISEDSNVRFAVSPDLTELRRFVLFGTAIGIYARSFSASASFFMNDWQQELESFLSITPDIFTFGNIVGSIIILLLILSSIRARKVSIAIPYLTISALSFSLITYLLVGFGRTEGYGALHSLALRYTAIPLLGFFSSLAPLAALLLEKRTNLALTARKVVTIILSALLFAHLYRQLQFSESYNHYQVSGVQYRTYLPEIKDWEKRLADILHEDCTINVAGISTELSGNFPLLYAGDASNLYALYPIFDPYRMLTIINDTPPCG